jgi:hypothetical protein
MSLHKAEDMERDTEQTKVPASLVPSTAYSPLLLLAHLLRKAQGKAGSRRAHPGIWLGC